MRVVQPASVHLGHPNSIKWRQADIKRPSILLTSTKMIYLNGDLLKYEMGCDLQCRKENLKLLYICTYLPQSTMRLISILVNAYTGFLVLSLIGLNLKFSGLLLQRVHLAKNFDLLLRTFVEVWQCHQRIRHKKKIVPSEI